MSLPPVIVTKRPTPSRSAWSSSACARVTSRVSVSAALASSNSGRTPVHTRSARACGSPARASRRRRASRRPRSEDRVVVGVVGVLVGRADHADGADGDEDVAVGRHLAAVDDRVHQPVVHRDHDPAARQDADALDAGHVGDVPGPRAGRVDGDARLHVGLLARARVAQARARDLVAVAVHGDGRVVGQHARAALLRAARHAPRPSSTRRCWRRGPGRRARSRGAGAAPRAAPAPARSPRTARRCRGSPGRSGRRRRGRRCGVVTKKPPVSSMQSEATRRRIAFSATHSSAAFGSLTA